MQQEGANALLGTKERDQVKRRKVVLAGIFLACCAALGALSAPALATVITGIGADIPTNSLQQHGQWRTHLAGAAYFNMLDVPSCGNPTNIGLRNGSGAQETNSIGWVSVSGQKQWVRASNGSTVIPSGQYAFNSRLITIACSDETYPGSGLYRWSGTLTW